MAGSETGFIPQAEIVSWERRRADGSMHFARLNI